MAKTFVFVILTLILAIANSRYSSKGGTCNRDYDCPSRKCLYSFNKLCYLNRILTGKERDPELCVTTKCAQCSKDSHCKEGLECKWWKCVTPTVSTRKSCQFSHQCLNWQYCKSGKCKGRRCRHDSDCPHQRQCRQRRCTRNRIKG